MLLLIAPLICSAPQMRRSPAGPILFSRIDDSHCDMIHSSIIAVHCFDNALCGEKTNDLERILCRVLVKRKRNSRKAWIGALAAAI